MKKFKNVGTDVFDTESGKYIMSLALKVSHIEKRVLKKGNTKQLLDFYNRVHLMCENFKKEVSILESTENVNA